MPTVEFIPNALEAMFYIAMLLFVLYSLALSYHWFSYGSSRLISMTTLAVYLIVSAPLFLTMAIVIYIL
jgi:hypothetical protein